MDQVRIGIIGIGGMGSGHANRFLNGDIPNAKLTAVCDINPERLEHAKANWGDDIQCFDNDDAFFAEADVDGIMIATPHYDHPPLAIKGFENDLHVLCEKPAGVYTRQVREMNEAAAKSDKVFAIMFNQRQRPLHQKVRELVQGGELGNLIRNNWIITTWFRSQSYYDSGGWRATWGGEGGGVLLNQCPHNLDLWQWICGMPKRVRAFCSFGKYHDIEVEDDVTAYCEYEDGSTGMFVTSTSDVPGTNRLEITGDQGKLLMEDGKLTFWKTRVPISQFNKEYTGGFGTPEVWKIDIPTGGSGEEHTGVVKEFIAAIREGKPLSARGEEGINSLAISNAMLLSAWTDDWVDIPVDENLFFDKLQERIKSSTYEKKAPEGKVMDTSGTFN